MPIVNIFNILGCNQEVYEDNLVLRKSEENNDVWGSKFKEKLELFDMLLFLGAVHIEIRPIF